MVFRLGGKCGFEWGLFFVRGNEYRLCKRGINNCVSFTKGHIVQSNVFISQYSPRDIVQCKLQNRNVHLSYVSCILSKRSLNIHLKALNSSFKTTDHMLWNTFQIMFTVTHSIRAAIPLSTYCEVSSNERTLNHRPYHMQHSTSVVNTIYFTTTNISYHRNTTNLTVTLNSFHRNTQQPISPLHTFTTVTHNNPSHRYTQHLPP